MFPCDTVPASTHLGILASPAVHHVITFNLLVLCVCVCVFPGQISLGYIHLYLSLNLETSFKTLIEHLIITYGS